MPIMHLQRSIISACHQEHINEKFNSTQPNPTQPKRPISGVPTYLPTYLPIQPTNHPIPKRKLPSNLNNPLNFLPNPLPKIHLLSGIPTRHKRQLPTGIIHQRARKRIPTEHFLRCGARARVPGLKGGRVDGLQAAVRVPDEVEDEEEGWGRGWGLHLGVGFEGSGITVSGFG